MVGNTEPASTKPLMTGNVPSSSSSWQPPVSAPLTCGDVGSGAGTQADPVIVSAPGEASSGMAGAGRVLCRD